MPIRMEDIVHLEEIKATLATSLEGIKTAFEELTFGFLTVIDAHDALQTKHDALQARLDGEIALIKRAMNLQQTDVDTLSARD